jgi:hypothetical protein
MFNMAQRNIAFLAVFLPLAVAWSGPCFSVANDSGQATVVLSQEDFVKQRAFMLKDLDRKIELMQKARTCAEKSATPSDFQACNQALGDGIRAHMAEQKESK